jgi:hypothetical protein
MVRKMENENLDQEQTKEEIKQEDKYFLFNYYETLPRMKFYVGANIGEIENLTSDALTIKDGIISNVNTIFDNINLMLRILEFINDGKIEPATEDDEEMKIKQKGAILIPKLRREIISYDTYYEYMDYIDGEKIEGKKLKIFNKHMKLLDKKRESYSIKILGTEIKNEKKNNSYTLDGVIYSGGINGKLIKNKASQKDITEIIDYLGGDGKADAKIQIEIEKLPNDNSTEKEFKVLDGITYHTAYNLNYGNLISFIKRLDRAFNNVSQSYPTIDQLLRQGKKDFKPDNIQNKGIPGEIMDSIPEEGLYVFRNINNLLGDFNIKSYQEKREQLVGDQKPGCISMLNLNEQIIATFMLYVAKANK